MTVQTWLKHAGRSLTVAGIATARIDTLVLLEDETGRDRSWLLANQEHDLQIEVVEKLNTLVARRAQHIPLAYLRGKTEFYGRKFMVNHHVLEPRPESEVMIDTLKDIDLTTASAIVDVGTGSGALAITAKLELPGMDVFATDIDPDCVKTAQHNARNHHANIMFCQGDLLKPVPLAAWQVAVIILANLPYVPDDFQINQAAKHEPRLAIFGGPDGLRFYRRLFMQLKALTKPAELVLTETLPSQHSKLAQIAATAGYKLTDTNDFIQTYRHIPLD